MQNMPPAGERYPLAGPMEKCLNGNSRAKIVPFGRFLIMQINTMISKRQVIF
jgi:hypothetical protein